MKTLHLILMVLLLNLTSQVYAEEKIKIPDDSKWENGNYDNLGLSLIDNPDGFGGTSYTYFHMNWGWYGQHNGWFIDATPESGTSYNYDRENLYISVN